MVSGSLVPSLLRKYPLISDQVDQTELRVILTALADQLENSPGPVSVVEFGCYIGTTSLFIRRVLDAIKPDAAFHVYDSFAGLPDKSIADESPAGMQFKAGELYATKKDFTLQFKKAGLRVPVIHKSWFSDLLPADVPTAITFAYLDGDYYDSVMDSLRVIWPKLAPGAIVVIDDYANEALPGAAKAVDEWVRLHRASMRVQSSLAILRTP